MNAELSCLQDFSTVQVDSRDLNDVLFFQLVWKEKEGGTLQTLRYRESAYCENQMRMLVQPLDQAI